MFSITGKICRIWDCIKRTIQFTFADSFLTLMVQRVLQAYKTSFSGLSRETWLLSLVMLVNRAGTMAVPFMSLYVTLKLGRSLAEAGLIITLFGVGSVLGALTGGFLTDRIGFRWVQIVSAISSGLLFIGYGYITDFTTLCVLTILLSMVADALRPANHAAIAAYSSRENLTRSYSLNRLAINLGWSVGGTVGGLLAAINYQLLFFVEGFTNIMAGVMILILLPSNLTSVRKFSKKQEHIANNSHPWLNPVFLQFMLFATLFTTAFFLVFRLVPVFWKAEWGISERGIGLLLGLNGIVIALTEMVLVRKLEKLGNTIRFIVGGTVCCGVGYALLLLPWGSGLAIATCFILAITLGEMLAFPFITSYIMSQANPDNRGAYATAITLSWSFAQIIGPSGGGWIAEHFGFTWLWVALIALCLITGLGFSSFARKYHGIPKSIAPSSEV